MTDQDIERYLKTIPNQRMESNVGDVVGELLKIAVYKSFVNTVTTNAQANRNVINFKDDYIKVKSQLDEL
ncbi:MAG: hypothetical protein GY861_23125 [bacterium]|nr:hypothetical protein [bacterium]